MYTPTGQPLPGIYPMPGMPGGEHMPAFSKAPIGPTMPTSIFPSSGRRGDVITIAGPFGGLGPVAQLQVKFVGSSWTYPTILGPGQATVRVPMDAETGAVEIEVNGRSVGRPQFVITGTSTAEPQKRWKVPWQDHHEFIKTSGLGSCQTCPGPMGGWQDVPSWVKIAFVGGLGALILWKLYER